MSKRAFFLVLFALLIPLPLRAAPPALVVVLLPGTSLADWQNADAPHLHRLMQTGALAVMNTRTAHRPGQKGEETLQSALLTLGAGSRAADTRQSSRHLGYDLRPGSLAETLTGHGITVVAGGGPSADVVAADGAGAVRRLAKLQAAPGQCVIWDAGSNSAAADAVIDAAARLAAISRTEAPVRLVVLSPFPSAVEYTHTERLTPVLLWGAGVPAGLLLSPSTHRAGLVTNTDFAPSAAAYFGISRPEFRPLPFGFAWSAVPRHDALRRVEQINSEAVRQADGMRILPYLAAALGLWIFALTFWLASGRMLGALALVPLAALAAALFAVSAWSLGGIAVGVFSLLCWAARRRYAAWSVCLLAAGLTLTVAADMLTGNTLMHKGLLGYSAIEGARYYGLGNEAMGLLLGCGLVGACYFWAIGPLARFFTIGLMGTLVLLLGTAGAKAGGVPVAVSVFGTFLFAMSGRRWTGWTVLTLCSAAAAGLAAFAVLDAWLLPQAHSHIGEAVHRIVSGGLGEAGDITRRKLAVEGRLAYHSAWAVLLWAALLCTGFLWQRMPAGSRADAALRPAGAAGALACLLLNDAGVVAAAIFAAVLWSFEAAKKIPAPVEPGKR